MTNINILSVPAPIADRANEDAWLALEITEPPGYVIAAVIDGAGARLTLPPLQDWLKQHRRGLTAAALAAVTVQTSLITQFINRPDRPLDTALLGANEALHSAVAAAAGGFSAEHILELAGEPPDSDPRRVRLALPACVVTLIRLDYTNRRLEYAHAGDTSLLEIRRDGTVIRHTSDQMGPYDQAALRLAVDLKEAKGLPHIAAAVRVSEVRRLNRENGLRHNFVDEHGRTQPGAGCGVIDGLPELADYLELGSLDVDPEQTEGFCLLTDGLELLAPVEESDAELETRLRETGKLLQKRGLHGLFGKVKAMAESDPFFDTYPRMKARDDATGIFLQLRRLLGRPNNL